ncbi:MAG: WD40 repeat domain-containing protein [Pseudonocardiaceae bacterium]
MEGHPRGVRALATDLAGTWLACAGDDGVVRCGIWRLAPFYAP